MSSNLDTFFYFLTCLCFQSLPQAYRERSCPWVPFSLCSSVQTPAEVTTEYISNFLVLCRKPFMSWVQPLCQQFNHQPLFTSQGFPGDSNGKESACHAGDLGLIPGFGRSPGEGHGNPLQYSCLVNSMDRGLGRLPSIGSQRVGRYWATNTHTYTSWKWGCVSPSESYQVTYNVNTSHYWWCLFWSLVRVKQVYLK